MRFGDDSLLHLASGIALNPEWPEAAFGDMAQLACASVDASLREALGGSLAWEAEGDAQEAGDADESLLLVLVARDGPQQHAFVLSAAVRTLLRWLADSRWRPQEARSSAAFMDGLPCDGELLLGCTEVRLDDLSTLRAGDALLFDETFFDDEGCALLRFGCARMHVRLSATNDALFERWGIPKMMNDEHGQGAYGGDAEQDLETMPEPAVDALGVTLEFSMGSCRINLGQLRSIRAGSIVTLERSARSKVAIMANGVRIGSGELIDIDGRLGVEVEAWGGPN